MASRDYLERVIQEVLSPDLSQALVMIYCRYLPHQDARMGLRELVGPEAELLRQFDALDELHADHPFTPVQTSTYREELIMLYRHNLELRFFDMLQQLRRLCQGDALLISAFNDLDYEDYRAS